MVHACDAVQEKSLAVVVPALKEAPYILFANQNYAGIRRDAGQFIGFRTKATVDRSL